jgi:aryl-alcohol dehydrogenase-like predicted oxidoreductase
VDVAIVGSRHPAHIEGPIGALDIQLDDDDLAEIDRIMAGAATAAGPSPEMAR